MSRNKQQNRATYLNLINVKFKIQFVSYIKPYFKYLVASTRS